MKKLILLSVLVLSGCLEKETTFKGCPSGLVYENNMCAKPSNPPVDAVYYDLGLKGSEGGSVVITFANNSSLTCIENCPEIITPVPQGTTGSAQANPKEGFQFSGWEDFSGNPSTLCFANPCSLTVSSAFNLKPKFMVVNSEQPITGQIMMFSAAAGPSYDDGNALWRTDGTAAGTVLVKDPNPRIATGGFPGISYFPLSVIDNLLYFGASTGPATGSEGASGGRSDNMELWTSNGLTSGTNIFADLNTNQLYQGPFADPPFLNQGSNPYGMIKKESNIIMSAAISDDNGQEYVYLDENNIPHTIDLLSYGNNGNSGESLGDGLFSDRVLLPNGNLIFRAYQWAEDPYSMSFGSNRYFSGFAKIFVTPTGENEPQLKFTSTNEFQCSEFGDMDSCYSLTISCSYNEYTDYENCMDYDPETFECTTYSQYSVCEGPTQRYTEQFNVSQIMYDKGAPMALYVKEYGLNNTVNYLEYKDLYATDGINEIQIDNYYHPNSMMIANPYPNQVVYFKGQYYFVKQSEVSDINDPSGYVSINQLVRTQLPDSGLQVVMDNVNEIHKVNEDKLIYILSESLDGNESPLNGLYLYDGESVSPIALGIYPSIFTNATGRVYFRDYANNVGNLSYMNMDTNEIVLVKEDVAINGFMGIVNDKIIFSAFRLDTGFEPWVSDGTEVGTFLLKDLKPGPEDGVSNTPKGYILNPNNQP